MAQRKVRVRRKSQQESPLSRQITRGVRFLNREYGRSWLRNIRMETLALEEGTACVLGQLEGDYTQALEVFGQDAAWARKHGFTTSSDVDDPFWAQLTKAWKRRIAAERHERGVVVVEGV